MNKNLKAVLIIGGVVVAILAIAFVAEAAGLNTYARLPYWQRMMQGVYGNGWQGGMMGGYGGMMGGYGGMMGGNYGGMMGGQWSGGMGPYMMGGPNGQYHCNWTGTDGQAPWESCPYYNQAQ